MVRITFKIREVDEGVRFVRELPKKFDKELTETNKRFMKKVRDDARKNAPRDTGSLKASINLEPVRRGKNVKIWKIVVDSPYASFQEHGYTPHSFFAGNTFNSSKMVPGKTYFVSKFTPFLGPALDKNLAKLDNKLNNALNKAIKE